MVMFMVVFMFAWLAFRLMFDGAMRLAAEGFYWFHPG
jgi:hypothetical protein